MITNQAQLDSTVPPEASSVGQTSERPSSRTRSNASEATRSGEIGFTDEFQATSVGSGLSTRDDGTAAVSRAERWLVVVLWLDGLAQFVAVLTVLMPFAWMDAIHRWWGLGPLPDEPVVGYLTRSLSALYAVRGAVTIYLTRDVRRYWPLIRFWFITVTLLGFTLLAVDLVSGMPWLWTLFEGPLIVGLGVLVLVLQRQCEGRGE